jgi:hypothetical protein
MAWQLNLVSNFGAADLMRSLLFVIDFLRRLLLIAAWLW